MEKNEQFLLPCMQIIGVQENNIALELLVRLVLLIDQNTGQLRDMNSGDFSAELAFYVVQEKLDL